MFSPFKFNTYIHEYSLIANYYALLWQGEKEVFWSIHTVACGAFCCHGNSSLKETAWQFRETSCL